MSKYKYFVKTEQELFTEFGVNWRSFRVLGVGFPTEMNHLLGIEIDIKYYNEYIVDDRLVLPIDNYIRICDQNRNYGTWSLNNNLIKEVLITPTYNEKRKLIYE